MPSASKEPAHHYPEGNDEKEGAILIVDDVASVHDTVGGYFISIRYAAAAADDGNQVLGKLDSEILLRYL